MGIQPFSRWSRERAGLPSAADFRLGWRADFRLRGLLILKPTYKKGWTFPGGQVDPGGESP
jgi:hypothetical protein